MATPKNDHRDIEIISKSPKKILTWAILIRFRDFEIFWFAKMKFAKERRKVFKNTPLS